MKNTWFYFFRSFYNKLGLLLWGRAVRICVFQLGEYGRFSILRKIIQRYEKKPRINVREADYYLKILEELGGVRNQKRTDDDLAIIEYMILTNENLEKVVNDKGGEWKKLRLSCLDENICSYKIDENANEIFNVIFCKEDIPSQEWNRFYIRVMKELKWDEITIVDERGINKKAYVTYKGEIGEGNSKKCFLRCHSPGRSYPMEMKYIGLHLGIKSNVCVFDYRGTYNSYGKPSEGGYYLDADAVFNELIQYYDYDTKNIWVTGFSLGGAVAAYIKMKYHHLGVNYIGENTFCSLKELLFMQCWFADFAGNLGLPSILSHDSEITSLVKQDYFDTREKFKKLENSGKFGGTVIVVSTEGDNIVPKEEAEKLCLSAGRFGKSYHLVCNKKDDIHDGHMDRPVEDSNVWEKYSGIIFSLDR
jgi:hypothetical protein